MNTSQDNTNPCSMRLSGPNLTIAATSFAIPDTVGKNCMHLAGKFPEIGILFFETEACLNYGPDDLPPEMSDLPLNYHAHLPLDLPWEQGLDPVWEVLSGLIEKLAFLSPRAYVLHPPPEHIDLSELAVRFRNNGIDPALVLLENVEEGGLVEIWSKIEKAGFGVCLDIGHMLAFGQEALLDVPEIFKRVKMIHVYAPGPRAEHRSLDLLNQSGKDMFRNILGNLRGQTTITLEVFAEDPLLKSRDTLLEWLREWRIEP